MKKQRKIMDIDKKKLDNELKKKGLSYKEASKKIYMNEHYFSLLLSSDRNCSPRAIQAMNDLLGIPYESIMPDPKLNPEPAPKSEEKPAIAPKDLTIDYNMLDLYIRRAVATAIEDRLPKIMHDMFGDQNSDFPKILGKAIYIGTKKAMIEALASEGGK